MIKSAFLLLNLICITNIYSFAENTTKGYANCMACHVAPNGGGIITDYGRSLSAELMSTWNVAKGFENPYYGLAKNNEHIIFGGELRTIQVHSENDQVKVKKGFVMQNNLEFAAKYMNAFVVASVGRQEGPKETPTKGEFLSEKHYLLWNTSDQTTLRVGKFRQHFGINHSNHTRLNKQLLGFGSNSETYNLEFMKFYEWGEINISTSTGDFFDDEKELANQSKKNYAFNFTHYIGGKARVGFSYLMERNSQFKRKITNLNAIFAPSKNSVFTHEVTYEEKKNITQMTLEDKTQGLYGEHNLGHKIFKGGRSYFVFEHAQTNLSDSKTLVTSPGIGFQFLPIPHVELQIEYQRRKRQSQKDNPEHRSFAVLHLYH